MEKLNTGELLRQLSNLNTKEELEAWTDGLQDQNLTFPAYMQEKLEERNMRQATLIEAAQLQRNYGYQILNGVRNPGREKVVSLCLALHLTVDEAQRALSLAGVSRLYARNRRDSILLFALQKELSVQETNELLFELDEPVLD